MVARPARKPAHVQDRQRSHQQHEHARDVMVVLGPGAVGIGAGRVRIVDATRLAQISLWACVLATWIAYRRWPIRTKEH